MKKTKIGINGFGRIGRCIARILENHPELELVHINTMGPDPKLLSYLLQYDSIYRKFGHKVGFGEGFISIDGRSITLSGELQPQLIDWSKSGVEIVIDSTGAFATTEALSGHLGTTVKKVILTAPAKDDLIPDVVLGVNIPLEGKSEILSKNNIIANASCTTNCVAPMLKIIQDELGIECAFLTTIHAYTATQSLVDEVKGEPSRSRAAGLSIVPTTTGASKAISKVLPELTGKVEGTAIRVPVASISYSDIQISVASEITTDQINQIFYKASNSKEYAGILGYCNEELVSSDFIGDTHSCIFDSLGTKVYGANKKQFSIFGWYDNEWGYSNRVVDLLSKVKEYF